MDGDDIVMQLVAKIDPNEYMAFGLSKNDTKSEMVGADAVVAFFDASTGRGHAIDYHLESKQQCVGSFGSCPDIRFTTNVSTDSITLLHAAVVNGFTMVTFKRPLVAVDDVYDQHVYSDGPQAIIWAIGALNQRKEVSYHYNRANRNNFFIDFSRKPKWNCPSPGLSSDKGDQSSNPFDEKPVASAKPTSRKAEIEPNPHIDNFHNVEVHDLNREVVSESKENVWKIPPIVCPADKTFRVQIGPTGGKRLSQITNRVGWGLTFWIAPGNKSPPLMSPELVVERGQQYTFILETGNDPEKSSRKHPFYITDSSEGGFSHKRYEDQMKEKIYAGVEISPENNLVPIGEGRLCAWQVNTSSPQNYEEKIDFQEYQKSLSLKCDETSEPGVFTWTVDQSTPDNLYYQCFTHRYLGWKIRVVDSCDHLTSASMQEDYSIRIKPSNFRMNKENQIHYVERNPKQSWNKNLPLQNQQINKIKQKIRKNQNVRFQVKPTTISTPIAFESTRIRTPQSASTMIFKEDALNKNTITFSKIDRQPKKQIKELKLQFAKNMSIIPTIQDRQLIAPPIITPVLSTRRVNMNRGRPRAKQINDNTVTYVRQKIGNALPPNLVQNYQIKPTKPQYLKQAQKLDLDQINLNIQDGFLPIFIDSNYGQLFKARKDKKLQVTLPAHLPINIPLNLPLTLAPSINENANELTSNNINVNSDPPISLALRKNKEDKHLPSTISTTTISSLIIPQTKRILSYLSSTKQDKNQSSNTPNLTSKFSSQPINVNLKVPTTLKIPKLPTTTNPFISSLHSFTVKQILKSMEQSNDHHLTTIKPNKKQNLLTIRPRKPTTTSTTTTSTTTTTTTTTTTEKPTTTTKKPAEIYASNFDPSVNFGDLSSSSYYHSVHVVPPNQKANQTNKETNKLNNHQLGLIDLSKSTQAARVTSSSSRISSVSKYQPNLTNTGVDNAILSHILSLISNNEQPPEILSNKRQNSRRPTVIRDDDLNNVNYFDNGYEVELHEKLN